MNPNESCVRSGLRHAGRECGSPVGRRANEGILAPWNPWKGRYFVSPLHRLIRFYTSLFSRLAGLHPRDRTVVTSAAATDVGRVRQGNEDAYCCDDVLQVYVLSDGMGGHEGGEVASKLVTDNMAHFFMERYTVKMHEDAVIDALSDAVVCVNDLVRDTAAEDEALHEMGATVVLCFIRDRTAYFAHLGDSRAYLLRRPDFQRLTEDHGLAEMLVQQGRLRADEAKNHPTAHVLTRHVGMDPATPPSIGVLDLEEGDRILLCSDGLTNMLSDRKLARILANADDLGDAVAKMVAEANDAGGMDNITVIAIQFGKREDPIVDNLRILRTIGRVLRERH